jgi:hypothetical protein
MPTILKEHLPPGVELAIRRATTFKEAERFLNVPMSLSPRAEAAAQKMVDNAWPGALRNDDTCAALMIGCGIPISHIAGEWDQVVKRARELVGLSEAIHKPNTVSVHPVQQNSE